MLWATVGPQASATALAYCQPAACHGEQTDLDNKMKLWAACVAVTPYSYRLLSGVRQFVEVSKIANFPSQTAASPIK